MIKFKLFFYIIFTVYLTSCVTKGQRDNTTLTNSIILETDIGNDVDDALALDMLYKYLDAKKNKFIRNNDKQRREFSG